VHIARGRESCDQLTKTSRGAQQDRPLKCSCGGHVSVVTFERFIPPGTATANRVVLIEFLGKETGHALDTRRNQ
jgi:hypothetical protein